jgi:hypothetical protein
VLCPRGGGTPVEETPLPFEPKWCHNWLQQGLNIKLGGFPPWRTGKEKLTFAARSKAGAELRQRHLPKWAVRIKSGCADNPFKASVSNSLFNQALDALNEMCQCAMLRISQKVILRYCSRCLIGRTAVWL